MPSPKDLLRLHALPLTVATLSLLFALLGNAATEALRYDRGAIIAGQLWRLLTGNLVHLGWPHLWLNLAGLALVWLLFYQAFTLRAWTVISFGSALAVGAGLLAFDPGLQWYVGLSGALHGLFVAGLLAALFSGHRAEWLLLVLFAAKLTWEQLVGPTPGTAQLAGGNVIVDAHLFGTIGGAIVAGIVLMVRRHRHRNAP